MNIIIILHLIIIMVSATIPTNQLLLLIAFCTYLSQCRVESFSLHQSSLSAATTRGVIGTALKSQQQIRPSSTSLFMSDAALSLTADQEGAYALFHVCYQVAEYVHLFSLFFHSHYLIFRSFNSVSFSCGK